jgi:hypothetical protein
MKQDEAASIELINVTTARNDREWWRHDGFTCSSSSHFTSMLHTFHSTTQDTAHNPSLSIQKELQRKMIPQTYRTLLRQLLAFPDPQIQ